jgi:SAM-dependent methyltransferase
MSQNIDSEIPIADESACCPLCGASAAIELSTRGRFGMSVRNVCCNVCSTVYITPRPTEAAMADYYRSTYRKHYGSVGYQLDDGTRVGPEDPGFETILRKWHENQARTALALCRTQPGARVLEIGCRHAMTLRLMREARGIEAHGIEPGEAEAEEARRANVKCFTGTLDNYEATDLKFDQIQLFHVLEHLHRPLESLVRLRNLLTPGGALLVEVPNAYQPYGLLDENFFQNVHLVTYSPNTLPALFRRAGLAVESIHDGKSLFVVGRRNQDPETLPIPYTNNLLPHADQNTDWLVPRLRSYANLEKLRFVLNHNGYSPNLLGPLIHSLKWPAFEAHLTEVCAAFTETFASQGLQREALMLTLAVAQGPFSDEVRDQFRAFAERIAGTQLPTPETLPKTA